ncbi:MAG: DNA polymerase III subunit gamma/tau [Gammaproteobacteria bacterium]|nr:DNA polymerase III subunit gamma/tau [Gammaproteobacteria bacterium]
MSYQVLARKWRPTNFAEVAGQAHVLKSLINALDNQRLHHAYLLTGTRGVGKTTLARILAKCLNCEEGISSKPCGKCNACTEINEGRFIDLIEVDAASRTKVEDTRELLENVQYSPARGRFKVYLIDEVHMLSGHSFNALLKTLEEPPPHVKFLFATTDPQKLPVTILSRCLQFNLKNLSPQIIVEYLQKILAEESIEYDDEALWQIAAAASGSMRDALTLVDQGISYCQGSINTAGIIEMLGVPEQQQVFALLEAMAARDVETLLEIINKISDQTPDYGHTLDSLMSALHRLAVAQAVPGAVDNSFGDKEKIQELAAKFSAEDLQLYYQIGSKGRDELRFSMELKSAFEMLLLRMLIFSPNFADEKETLATANDVKKKISLAPDQEGIGNVTEDAVETAPINPIEHESFEEDGTSLTDESEDVANGEINHDKWLELYAQLGVNGIAANIFANTEFKGQKGDQVYFLLSEAQSAVYNEDIVPKLSHALSELLGKQVSVNIEIGQVGKETPAMLVKRLKQEAREEMIDEFEKDENVQEMLKHFSAKLAKESIFPVKE